MDITKVVCGEMSACTARQRRVQVLSSGFCMFCIFPKAYALCGFLVALHSLFKLLDLFCFVEACLESNLYV